MNSFKKFRTWWQGQLRRLHNWNLEHAMQRKLIIVGSMLTIMLALLIGTRLVPQTSKYNDTGLNNYQSLGSNSDVQIAMTSRKYNPEKDFMVVQFNVKSDSGAAIDLQKIKFKLAMINVQPVKYTVIPLTNNQIVVTIRGIKSGYQAIQLKAINKAPNASALDQGDTTDVLNTNSSSSSSSSPDDETGSTNSVKFIINENKDFESTKLQLLNQKDYTIKALQKQINTLKKTRKHQKKLIAAYQAQIEADKQSIENNNADAKYKVSDSSSSTGNSNAQSDISTRRDNIKTSRKNIKKIDQQIELYQQQIRDVQSGKYEIQSGSTTSRLK